MRADDDRTGADLMRETTAYRVALGALAISLATVPTFVVVFVLMAIDVISNSWLTLLFAIVVVDVVTEQIAVVTMVLKARRAHIQTTDPFYMRQIVRYAMRDLRSLLSSGRFPLRRV